MVLALKKLLHVLILLLVQENCIAETLNREQLKSSIVGKTAFGGIFGGDSYYHVDG